MLNRGSRTFYGTIKETYNVCYSWIQHVLMKYENLITDGIFGISLANMLKGMNGTQMISNSPTIRSRVIVDAMRSYNLDWWVYLPQRYSVGITLLDWNILTRLWFNVTWLCQEKVWGNAKWLFCPFSSLIW